MGQKFVYKVRDNSGQLLSGSLTAASRDMLVRKLAADELYILEISQAKHSRRTRIDFTIGRKVKNRDLMMFARQFTIMLEAGLPLRKCLSIMKEQTTNYYLQKALDRVMDDIEHGMPFWMALNARQEVFTRFFVYMVKSGEMSGTLREVMLSLALYLEKQDELAKKVSKALMYPAVVAVFAVGVVAFMLTFIMPEFISLYQNKDFTLPLITRVVLTVGDLLRTGFPWLALFAAASLLWANKSIKSREGRLSVDRLLLTLPVVGKVVRKLSVTRFTRALSILIGSGVPVLGALEVAGELVGNTAAQSKIFGVGGAIQQGHGLAKSLESCGIFESMAIQILTVGEETGTLADALSSVANYYESDISYLIDFLISLVEPFLILFLAVVVGSIVIACMVPMMQMTTVIGG